MEREYDTLVDGTLTQYGDISSGPLNGTYAKDDVVRMWQDLWREGKRVYSNFDQSGRNKQDLSEFLDYVSSKHWANK